MINPITEINNEVVNNTNLSVEPIRKSAHVTSLALVYALTAASGAKDLLAVADSKAASVKKAAPVDPANTDTTDYAAQLEALIAAFALDPTNMTKGLALIEFIITLSSKGLLTGSTPESQTLLNMLKAANITNMLFILDNNAALQFLSGGSKAALKFLEDIQKLLNAVPAKDDNSILDAMKQRVSDLISAFNLKGFMPANFSIVNGHLIYTSPITGQTYDCTNPSDLIIVKMLLSSSSDSGFPNSFWSSFNLSGIESAYMLGVFDEALKEFGSGNVMWLIAFILNSKDNMFQDQLNGYANTTNDLDDLTNQYITPLETLWANLGNWKPGDAETFFKDLTAATEIIGSNPAMQGFSSTWMTSVFSQISGTEITWKDSKGVSHTDTIANAIKILGQPNGPTSQELADAMNGLNPQADPAGGGTPPTPNPAYQMINNALMQGGGLVTQQSKMIGTLAAAIANSDDQLIKLFAGFTDKSGSGLVALMFNIINNFKSN